MFYPAGTLYSNSDFSDVATARTNEFGDTIFQQLDPAGKPTGRESVVIGGRLVGLEIAGEIHSRNAKEAAPAILAALQAAVRQSREAMSAEDRAAFDEGKRGPEWMFMAKSALAQALR